MRWINVRDELPKKYEEVLVWMKYDGDSEFTWNESWIEPHVPPYTYKEPITNRCWAMGSAKNYVITHWMRIEPPKKY